jgi:hypothetical protein
MPLQSLLDREFGANSRLLTVYPQDGPNRRRFD